MRLKDITILNPTYIGVPLDKQVSFVPMESLRYDMLDLQEIAFDEGKGKYTYFADNDLLIAKVTPCFENGNIAIAKNLKENIEKIDTIDGYNIYKFNYKDGYELPQGTRAGVIAQEVKEINPDAGVDNLQNTGFMGVDYSKLPAAVQDKINEINAEVE